MSKCKLVTASLATHFKLSAKPCPTSTEEIDKIYHVPYSSVVGSLMYAMVYTKLDLAYTITMESRYIHNPNKDHLEVVKWLLYYVKDSFDWCLVFNKSKINYHI